MDHQGIGKWLAERGLKLDESFPAAVRRLAKMYKREHSVALLSDVYSAIGTSKQEISWWENIPTGTQTKKNTNIKLSAQPKSCLS